MALLSPGPALSTSTLQQRQQRRLRAVLLMMALLDELSSGFPVVALPLLRDRLHLSYTQAGLLFTAGALSSLLLDPIINLLSDLGSKRIPILLGTLALVGSFLLIGFAPNYPLELVAFAVWYPANSAAVGLAQAALIDDRPQQSERTMTRWTLLSGVGDLLAPITVGIAVGVGLGWSALCLIAAGCWFVAIFFLAPQRFPRSSFHEQAASDGVDESGEPQRRVGLLAGLREAIRNKTLLRWAGIVVLATMPDEVFLAFAALYLHDHLHTPENITSFVLALGIGGGLAALFVLDRLQGRIAGVRLLPWLALVALIGFILLLIAPTIVVAAIGLMVVDIGAAGWYPIAQAAEYDSYPGRSGVIRAIDSLGLPFEMALPGFIGLLAARFGLWAGIGFLGLSPLGVLLLLPRRRHATAEASLSQPSQND